MDELHDDDDVGDDLSWWWHTWHLDTPIHMTNGIFIVKITIYFFQSSHLDVFKLFYFLQLNFGHHKD
jgi:hypothetical protein